MEEIRRGQVFLCDLEPRRGHEQGSARPVVVVSSDPYNASASPLIGIVPLTSSSAKNPLHLELGTRETGLRKISTALVDHLRFVNRERIQSKAVGELSSEALAAVDLNLRRVLALR
jgi:mRNA interferase MazF